MLSADICKMGFPLGQGLFQSPYKISLRFLPKMLRYIITYIVNIKFRPTDLLVPQYAAERIFMQHLQLVAMFTKCKICSSLVYPASPDFRLMYCLC